LKKNIIFKFIPSGQQWYTEGDQKTISRATNWYIEPPCNSHSKTCQNQTTQF